MHLESPTAVRIEVKSQNHKKTVLLDLYQLLIHPENRLLYYCIPHPNPPKRHNSVFKRRRSRRPEGVSTHCIVCMYTHIYMLTPPSKTHRAEDSDAYWCVKEPLFGKVVSFRMISSRPSIIHQIPTQYAVCDQHSVLLSMQIVSFLEKKLLKEHAAYRLQSALMIFPQVSSSAFLLCFWVWPFFRKDFTCSKQLPWRQGLPLSAETYNMWKNEMRLLIKFRLPAQFCAWHLPWKENVTSSK